MARRNRFVTPSTVRLELSDGDWLEVVERLTYAEQQRLGSASLVGINRTGGYDIDMARFNLLRIETWVRDWSFVNEDGKNVEVSPSAIRNLDPETAAEILAALDAYQEEHDADPNDKMIAESPSSGKS